MNKKIKLSNNQKAQQEINNFAIGSIGILIIGGWFVIAFVNPSTGGYCQLKGISI